MVLTSISIIPSSSSFLSDSPSTSTPTRNRTFPSSLVGFPKAPLSNATLRLKVRASSSSFTTQQENVSPEQYQHNNSIADFMRFKRGVDGGTGVLQTAIVSYRKKFLQVDLISTVHIADKEYYLALQKELESYDCVLYEMLKGTQETKDFDILGCIQRQMARILMLDSQDCLNYESENWLHADLDYETFQFLQRVKGESYFSFAMDTALRYTKPAIPEDLDPWRSKLLWASRELPMPLVGQLIIESVCADAGSQASEYPEIEALSRLDFSAAMKVFLAKILTAEWAQAPADVAEKSVEIGERNRVAIETLRRAMDKGNNRIAILYGGGHMPDLGRRLREGFDLIPSSVRWIPAWSISKRNLSWPLNRYQTLALLIFSSVLALDLWFWKLFLGTAVNWVSKVGSVVLQYVGSSQMI